MKQLHFHYDIRTYTKGANRDIEKELLFVEEGAYIDACNFRVVSMGGNYAAAVKINGEELLYPNIDNRCSGGTGAALSGSYECIGALEINDHIMEFWADTEETEPSLIRIDGQIVCYSADFPITWNHPLQIAKNESCIGGEVYITDFNVPPMIFNVEDLMSNSGMLPDSECTDKYFDGFNLAEHQLQVTNPIDHPVFIKLTSSQSGFNEVFGSGGLPVGYYSYQIRYATQAGDRTVWSVPTPLIPVVSRLSSGCSPTYPYSQTHSKDPDISSPSVYGIHLKFRVNNINNFDFIEVRRNSYNSGDALGVPPVSELIGSVNVSNGDVGVINVLDNGPQAEEILSPGEAAEAMSAISKAKAIRYFNGKLYLMNIEYASKDIDDEITFVDPTPTGMFPILEKIFKAGLKDPYKYTYNRPSMDGEKYGYAVVGYDDNNQFTYAKKIDDFENYLMPDRRSIPNTNSANHSYFGMPQAARYDGSIGNSFELFDLDDAVAKSDHCSFKNILDTTLSTGKGVVRLNYDNNCDPVSASISPHDVGYLPFTPTGQSDTRCGGSDYVINNWIRNVSVGTKIDYNPQGFAPNYYSLGMAFKGLETYPEWMKAFSVVRTPPAKRVIAQGIGYYSLNSAGGSGGANLTKNTDEFWFYSPDTDGGTSLDPNIVDDIIANPDNYQIVLVSPLGFFTEVYSANIEAGADKGVDLITYARIIRENATNPEMNPEEDATRGLVSGNYAYTAYGAWRYSAADAGNTVFPNGDSTAGPNGSNAFDITNFSTVTDNRANYFKIKLSTSVFNRSGTGGPVSGSNSDVRKWHEPLYIVNIIKKVADIADSNVQQYVHTGHYQKIESLIGVSDGSNGQILDLVDERWEDCMPSISGMTTNPYSTMLRFVHIDYGDGVKKRWINASNLSILQLNSIYTQLTASGEATIVDPMTSVSYTVYGVYSQQQTTDSTAPIYQLVFTQLSGTVSTAYFNPPAGSKIYVLYDNRIPIRFFGGDVSQGEATCAFLDKQYDKNANPNGTPNEFRMNLGFPNSLYNINDKYYIINRTTGLNKIQNDNLFYFDKNFGTSPSYIRQLTCMFACRSRADLTFSFNDESTKHSSDQYFALKNYVIRPYRWNDSQFGNGAAAVYSDNNMWLEYEDDYGDEFLNWGYGGFRFIHNVNIDYSKDLTDGLAITSVPQIGFEEEVNFCTRIAWSLERPINSQNTPSVRTFLSQNIFDISDDTGEIKYAYDALGGKGSNLYAFTQDGTCLLLTDKRIVSEINGNELATTGSDVAGILGEYWLSKEIGMNDEFWRAAAEYSNILYFTNKQSSYQMVDNAIQDIAKVKYHSKIYPEFLKDFPENYEGKLTAAYDVLHNEYWITFGKRAPSGINGQGSIIDWCVGGDILNVTDLTFYPNDIPFEDTCSVSYVGMEDNDTLVIHSNNDLDVALGGPVGNLLADYPVKICAHEDNNPDRTIRIGYWSGGSFIVVTTIQAGECICLLKGNILYDCPEPEPFEQYDCPTLAYSEGTKYWNGSYDYMFDKYVHIGNRTFGMRGMETYELGLGYQINGAAIMGVLLTCSSKDPFYDKEFTRFRVNSNVKPVALEFFDTIEQALTGDVQASVVAADIKNYFGYEQFIPRKTNPPRYRMQGRILFYKIIHNLEEDFRIIETGIQSKHLK